MKQKAKVVWVVISEDGFEGSYKSFNLAKESAEDCMEIEYKSNVQILEVVKAWEVNYPEEPSPETLTIDLENIDV